jgi:prepilin-type N-terminal cleavage/methylation domain-containing protein
MKRVSNNALKDREKGFTLLEVMAAITILTIGLLAVATMQSSAIRTNFKGYRLMEATNLAQDRIEYLLSQPYTDLQALVGTGEQADPWVEWATNHGLDYDMPEGFALTYEVTDEDSDGNDLPFSGVVITIKVQTQEAGTTELEYVRPAVF